MFSKMFTVAARLRDFVESRTHAQRYAVKQSLWVSLSGPKKTHSGPLPPSYALKVTLPGHTCDISENGLSMILPAVHLGGFYFTDGERQLHVTINVDDSTLEMDVLPVRYEQLAGGGYLVGAKILSVNKPDQPVFEDLMQSVGAHRHKPADRPLAHKMTPKAPLFGFMSRIL